MPPLSPDAFQPGLILLTGASGFLGKHLLDRLLAEGMQVRAMVRTEASAAKVAHDGLETVIAALDDPESLAKAMQGIHTVIHCAGLVFAPSQAVFMRVNATGTANVLKAAEDAGVERMIYISSQAAGGPASGPIPVEESNRPLPVSLYGLSKLSAEEILRHHGGKTKWVILRPCAFYGPGDWAFFDVVKIVAKGIRVILGGCKYFNVLHVRDVVEAIWLATTKVGIEGQTYFITNGSPISYEDYQISVARALHRRTRRVTIPEFVLRTAGLSTDVVKLFTPLKTVFGRHKVEELLEPYWLCSGRKAKEQLGFVPKIGLDEGQVDTVRWYRDNGWLKQVKEDYSK